MSGNCELPAEQPCQLRVQRTHGARVAASCDAFRLQDTSSLTELSAMAAFVLPFPAAQHTLTTRMIPVHFAFITDTREPFVPLLTENTVPVTETCNRHRIDEEMPLALFGSFYNDSAAVFK